MVPAELGLAFTLWWIYFACPHAKLVANFGARAYRWGYGHVVVFGALGAGGAASAVAVELVTTGATATWQHGLSMSLPLALFLPALTAIHAQCTGAESSLRSLVRRRSALVVVVGLAGPLLAPVSVPLLMAALVLSCGVEVVVLARE